MLPSPIPRTVKLRRFLVALLEGDAYGFDRPPGMIGRYFKDHPQVTAFFGTGVRLLAAIPGVGFTPAVTRIGPDRLVGGIVHTAPPSSF